VRTTSTVWGWQSWATKSALDPFWAMLWNIVIASAAAVPSSRSDAFATGSAVRSSTMVWKLSSASSRPCEISGWYGVY